MKSVVVLMLFVGMLMIVHGVYEEKYQAMRDDVRVEYRFVPRTYFEEQLAPASDTTSKFHDMFEKESPWGGLASVPRPSKI